jgi:DNA-binding SARP family transcriptional activator
MIHCRVLGPVEVTVDGAAAPPELLWRKHLALLLYLARSPKHARTREHLTGLLWPDKDESAARHSLNEALRVVRRVAGDTALDTAAGQVRLAAEVVRLDAEDLERLIGERRWADAARIIAGEFLEGFSVAGCEGIESWLASERRYWNQRAVGALLGWSEDLLREGHAGEALAAARRAEALNPHSDHAARAVMGALVVQGEAAAALAHGERFAAGLGRDLGSAPAEETRMLVDRIRGARGPRARPREQPVEAIEHRRAPLAGREMELGQLLALWERCRNGGGATAIVLVGESGTGKTRLLDEFTTRARLGGTGVALVRAVEGDLQEDGSGVLGLARGGLLGVAGVPAAPAPALASFASRLPEWAERFPAAPPVGGPTPAQAFGAVIGAILGEGPLLLVVDDAQWIDRASLLGLLAVLRDHAGAPLCLVLATLPHPPRPELDELQHRLGRDLPGATITLASLDGAALRALAAWALPGYDAVALERVCRRVSSDSAGLPLLAVELLAAVAQGLDLQQGLAAWPAPLHTLTQSLPGDFPDTVVAAMRIGFRRLSKDAQQVLAAASVLGETSTEGLLVRATGLTQPSVQAALDELEWQRWLETDGRGYGFVALLARRIIARDMVTAGQRTRIHERAGFPPSA